MAIQLNDVTVLINNEVISYTPDSIVWTEGFGTYSVRNAVVGGGQTEQIFSIDLSTKFSIFKMSMPTTENHVALLRQWKANLNNNVIELLGPISSTFTKIFTLAALLEDPELSAATDGNIEMEFNTNPAQ